MWKILDALAERDQTHNKIPPKYYAKVTFKVIEDQRQCFSTALTKEAHATGSKLTFPKSYLRSVYEAVGGGYDMPIYNIPNEWIKCQGQAVGTSGITQGKARSIGATANYEAITDGESIVSGMTGNTGTLQIITIQLPPPRQGNIPYLPGNNTYEAGDTRIKKGTSPSDTHHFIKAMMRPYYKRIKNFSFNEVLKGAGKVLADVVKKLVHPQHPLDDKGRNKLCFNNLCGSCRFKGGQFIHIPVNEVTNDFATKVVNELGPDITNFVAANKKRKNTNG